MSTVRLSGHYEHSDRWVSFVRGFAMTADEIYSTMAMKAPVKTAEEWQDFFSMEPALQEAEVRLTKTAIFQRDDGSSIWADMLGFLGVAATIAGDVTGVGSAFTFFKALA
jgi:hypothetical protein